MVGTHLNDERKMQTYLSSVFQWQVLEVGVSSHGILQNIFPVMIQTRNSLSMKPTTIQLAWIVQNMYLCTL
jgi:hypothetical protein